MKPNWFVALPVPAETWLQPLLANLPEGCKPFHGDDVHMTIAFLGAVPAAQITGLIDLVEAIRAKPLEISLGPMMMLPNPHRFSALSLSLAKGKGEAAGLIRSHRDAFADAVGKPHDTRKPLPHITTARPHRKASTDQRAAAAQWATSLTPPTQTLVLDRIALYTWAQDRRRRQFRIVFEQPLRGGD